MNNQISNKVEVTTENKNLNPFSFPCPHCQKTITSQDFQENNFLIAHLQSYFQNQEILYKAQLLQELASNPTNFPPYQNLLAEKEKLQLQGKGMGIQQHGLVGKPDSSKMKFTRHLKEWQSKIMV